MDVSTVKTVSDVMKYVLPGFQCLLHEKRNLDDDSYSEYADVDLRIKGNALFENPKIKSIREVPTGAVNEKTPTILRYFMDGSRRVFRFSDIILSDGRYYPVLAGQVGVAVLRRDEDGRVAPVSQYVRYENILVFPDTVSQADQSEMRDELARAINISFLVSDYETSGSGGNSGTDYINKGTKKILDRMHDLELDAVDRMMNNRDLRDDAMLAIDGSLQFRREVLTRNKFPIHQLTNVIGISKSFTPSQPISGMAPFKQLGAVLQDLDFKQRTPVFNAGDDSYSNNLGIWYLRIRPRPQRTSPLEGVLKIEVLANGDERENGLEQDRVDTLSALILSERNVTPYGSDARWANHIYPIYLTESYLKSGFLSDVHFKGLL